MALTDFFLSTEKALEKVGANGVPDSLPRFQTKDFHVVPLEKLGEMLGTGSVDEGEPIVHGDEYEWMVMGVSDDLAHAIAKLSDDETKKHGMAIARIDELHWPATDGIKVLLELRELARHVKDGTRLWLWVCAMFFLAACSSDPPARTPSGAKASCFADADCVVTDFTSCCSCCRSAPHAIPKGEADRQTDKCKVVECAKCADNLTCAPQPPATDFIAKCDQGTCAAVRR